MIRKRKNILAWILTSLYIVTTLSTNFAYGLDVKESSRQEVQSEIVTNEKNNEISEEENLNLDDKKTDSNFDEILDEKSEETQNSETTEEVPENKEESPETGDEEETPEEEVKVMEITSVEVDVINTGTAPFDSGTGVPEAGKDYSAKDNYVRSFDSMSYDVTVAMNGEEAEKADVYVTLEFPFEEPDKQIYFRWDTGNFKAEDVTLTNGGSKLTFRVKNFTVGQLYTKSVMLYVLNVPQGYEIKPIVSAKIADSETSVYSDDVESVFASTSTTFNARMRSGNNFELFEHENRKGRIVSIGLSGAATVLNSSTKGGFDFPKGDVEIEFDVTPYKIPKVGGARTPIDLSITPLAYGHNNFKNSRDGYTFSGYIPLSKTDNNDNRSVQDTGNISFEDLGDNKFKVIFSDYKITRHFPTRSYYGSETYNDSYKNFIAGAVELFVPFYAEEEGYNVSVDFEIKSVKFTDSEGNERTDETQTNDNKATILVYENSIKEPKIYTIRTNTGNSDRLIGSDTYIESIITYSGYKDDYYEGGAKILQVFDGNKLSINRTAYFTGTYQGALNATIEYGVGKLTYDEITGKSTIDESILVWYSSFEEAKKNETEENKITAVRGDIKNKFHDNTSGSNVALNSYVKVNPNTTDAYDVIPVRTYVEVFEDAAREKPSDLYSDKIYYAPVMNDNGGIATGNSPTNIGGNYIYAIPYDINLSKTVDDWDNGVRKQVYSVAETTEVNWVVEPYIIIPKEHTVTDIITITDTIPKGLIFVESSSTYPVKSVENLSNGQTKVTWVIDLYDCHAPLPTIKYKTEIPMLTPDRSSFYNHSSATTNGPNKNKWKNQTAAYTITVLNDASFKISKNVDRMLTEANNSFKYSLNWSNNGTRSYYDSVMLDILPTNINGTEDTFEGSYTITSFKVPDGITLEYTDQSPDTIKFNPLDSGVTDWKPITNGVSATALRWKVDLVNPNSSKSIELVITPNGNIGGDIYTNKFTARFENLNAVLYSNKVTTEVKKDLIVTNFKIYDTNNTQMDITDDTLIAEITRDENTEAITTSFNEENKPKLKNNRIYRLETSVYNNSKFPTSSKYNNILNTAIDYKFLFDSDAVDVKDNGTYRFINGNVNYLGRSLTRRETGVFVYDFYIPISKKDKVSIHSGVNYGHFVSNDNLKLENDGLSVIFDIENTSDWDITTEKGDIRVVDTYVTDTDMNKLETVTMGDTVKLVYKAEYLGPTIPREYIIIGHDPITNSPIYAEVDNSVVVQAKGKLNVDIDNVSNVEYDLTLGGSSQINGNAEKMLLKDKQYIYFTSDEFTITVPNFSTELSIVDVNDRINSDTTNDTFNFKKVENINLSISNVKVNPRVEATKDLDKVNAVISYDIYYDVPEGTKENHAIMVDSLVTFGSTSRIVSKLVTPGNNTFFVSMTTDISDKKPDYKGEEFTLNSSVTINVNNKNYEYHDEYDVSLDNYKTSVNNGLNLMQSSNDTSSSENLIERQTNYTVKDYTEDVIKIATLEIPIYKLNNKYDNQLNYQESLKVKQVQFLSKSTEDNDFGNDGWVDLNNGDNEEAVVKAGYGFKLRVVIEYLNNIYTIPSMVDNNKGSSIELGYANLPNDLIIKYGDEKYSATGIDSDKIFKVVDITETKNSKIVTYELEENEKIYVENDVRDGLYNFSISTPSISGIQYTEQNKTLGDTKLFNFNVKGSYLDDLNVQLDH